MERRAIGRLRISVERLLFHLTCHAVASRSGDLVEKWKNIDGKLKSGLDGDMKTKTLLLTLAMTFATGMFCFAASSQMGTWNLNEAKSKLTPGMAKNNKVVYKAAGNSVKVTIDGTDADGKSTHNEWTGKFDGKDYAVTGDPTSDTRSYKKIDDRTMEFTVKKDGKVTITGRIVVAADGKSRTVTTSGTDAKGKKFKNTTVYDKA